MEALKTAFPTQKRRGLSRRRKKRGQRTTEWRVSQSQYHLQPRRLLHKQPNLQRLTHPLKTAFQAQERRGLPRRRERRKRRGIIARYTYREASGGAMNPPGAASKLREKATDRGLEGVRSRSWQTLRDLDSGTFSFTFTVCLLRSAERERERNNVLKMKGERRDVLKKWSDGRTETGSPCVQEKK